MRFILCFLLINTVWAAPSFQLTPIGVYGGLDDGNLSAYLLKPIKEKDYVMLDAGTLTHGLKVALEQQSIKDKNLAELLQTGIRAYLISHAHFDHLMGLIIAQPELRQQQVIMGREETMDALKKYIFNWSVWGNFGDSGEAPQLKYQYYQNMKLNEWMAIPNTQMYVKALPLSHGQLPSTAFLIRYQQAYILYFGDTGADQIEGSTHMKAVWEEVAPLIRAQQVHAILLECSFADSQAKTKLFGHLKPELYLAELAELAKTVDAANPQTALLGLKVLVTHIKPSLENAEETRARIYNELVQNNHLGLNLILPEQGRALLL